MSSHAQDQGTQAAASTGAQTSDATLDANAAQNQAFANQSRATLFGSYNPTTNTYTGGSESAYLNPNSTDTTSLNGSYANEYNTEANANAEAAKTAVGTTLQNLSSRGMGKTPAGFAADQERQAYQTEAANNGTTYSNLFGQQHAENVQQFNNATSLLSNNSTGADQLSESGTAAAAGNYSGLYGTASTPVQSAWGTVLGTAGTLAGAGATAYAGR